MLNGCSYVNKLLTKAVVLKQMHACSGDCNMQSHGFARPQHGGYSCAVPHRDATQALPARMIPTPVVQLGNPAYLAGWTTQPALLATQRRNAPLYIPAHLSASLTSPVISCTPRCLALSSMPSDSMACSSIAAASVHKSVGDP